jgi:hypothetical protein
VYFIFLNESGSHLENVFLSSLKIPVIIGHQKRLIITEVVVTMKKATEPVTLR